MNTGDGTADNITLKLTGLPSPWYEVRPGVSGQLRPGNTTIFVISFKIPANAMIGEYSITMLASDGSSSDEKPTKLKIFKSERELVEDELDKVRDRYNDVVDETDTAEKYGKDVTSVRSILDEAKASIDRAVLEFNNESYTQAMSFINTANELITRAQEELGMTRYRPDVVTEGIPLWQIVVIIVCILAANALLLIWRKKAYKKIDFKQDLLKVRNVIKSRAKPAGEGVPHVDVEKRKMQRVLDLLESEMKDGLITKKTYEELKKRTEKKMKGK